MVCCTLRVYNGSSQLHHHWYHMYTAWVDSILIIEQLSIVQSERGCSCGSRERYMSPFQRTLMEWFHNCDAAICMTYVATTLRPELFSMSGVLYNIILLYSWPSLHVKLCCDSCSWPAVVFQYFSCSILASALIREAIHASMHASLYPCMPSARTWDSFSRPINA